MDDSKQAAASVPGLSVQEREGLLLLVMYEQPTPATFAASAAAIRAAFDRHVPLTTLVVIPAFTQRPVENEAQMRESQKAFLDSIRDLGPSYLATGIVITVPGLKGSFIRLAVSSMLMLGRVRREIAVHSSLEEAARWVASLRGQTASLRLPGLAAELHQLVSR